VEAASSFETFIGTHVPDYTASNLNIHLPVTSNVELKVNLRDVM
jgi:hypothetical protein